MRGQSRSALGIARHLTGSDNGLERILRINPPVPAGKFSLDDTKGIRDLQGFAYGQARHAVPDVMTRFFTGEAEPFIAPTVLGTGSKNYQAQ